MIVLGIDPGASGGIARICEKRVIADKFPATEADLWDEFEHRHRLPGAFAFIEKVSSMPGQGVSSTFKFGQHYGMLRAFLIAAGIPFETVTPSVWQKPFGLIRKSKAETITQKKNRHKAKAQELFPQVGKITHAIADALLIAHYGRITLAKRGTRWPPSEPRGLSPTATLP